MNLWTSCCTYGMRVDPPTLSTSDRFKFEFLNLKIAFSVALNGLEIDQFLIFFHLQSIFTSSIIFSSSIIFFFHLQSHFWAAVLRNGEKFHPSVCPLSVRTLCQILLTNSHGPFQALRLKPQTPVTALQNPTRTLKPFGWSSCCAIIHQTRLDDSKTFLADPYTPLAGIQLFKASHLNSQATDPTGLPSDSWGWFEHFSGWPSEPSGLLLDEQMGRQNFSPFFRTQAPIGSAALLPSDTTVTLKKLIS